MVGAGVSSAAPVVASVVDEHIVTSRRVQFVSGRIAVTPQSKAVLARVAEVIRRDLTDGSSVVVEGHGDVSGDAHRDVVLAAARAEEVVRLLIALGVPRERLSARGRGTEVPLVPATSPEQWRNRRVEFVVVAPAVVAPALAALDDVAPHVALIDDAAAAAVAVAAPTPTLPLLDDDDGLLPVRFALAAESRPQIGLLDEPDLIAPSFAAPRHPNVGLLDEEGRP